MMTKIEAIEKMKDEQNNSDTEAAHCIADDILCEFLISLGHQDLVDEYERVPRWYS